MENQVERDEAIAQAEAAVNTATEAVTAAEAAVPSNKEAVAKAAADLKEAKGNLKAAKDYRKALAEDAPEIGEADESVTGWSAEVDRLLTAHEDAKATAAGSRDVVKTAKAELREAKKALTAAKKQTKPKVEREERNGMKRPVDGGPSHKVWDAADKAQAELGRAPALGDILDGVVEQGVKEATVKAAYAHWRKFHGITGRIESAEQVATREAKAKEKADKAAEREAAKAAKAAEAPAPEAPAAPEA